MSKITDLRRELRDAVLPVLNDGEECEVAAAPSDYAKNNGFDTLRFSVRVALSVGGAVSAEDSERLDDLLDPQAGVRAVLDDVRNARHVTRSSGHQTFPDGRVGATWTVEVQQ